MFVCVHVGLKCVYVPVNVYLCGCGRQLEGEMDGCGVGGWMNVSVSGKGKRRNWVSRTRRRTENDGGSHDGAGAGPASITQEGIHSAVKRTHLGQRGRPPELLLELGHEGTVLRIFTWRLTARKQMSQKE